MSISLRSTQILKPAKQNLMHKIHLWFVMAIFTLGNKINVHVWAKLSHVTLKFSRLLFMHTKFNLPWSVVSLSVFSAKESSDDCHLY